MINYDSIAELINAAIKSNRTISEIVLEEQEFSTGIPAKSLYNQMSNNLNVMREAVDEGLKSHRKSASGLIGGEALKLKNALDEKRTVGMGILDKALVKALAVSEVNACMGRIVASPTAGSCGIIPAVILTVMEEKEIPENKVVMSLFTSAGFGLVIAKQASISGAEGGCQAECGSAAAMAAAALVEMLGGTPHMSATACAIALKNVLGLVCDPVAGLVEVPCVKRNAAGAANALVAADLALAGIESAIPVDEVISAMGSIGRLMSVSLKETAEGGLAATPTGCMLAKKILQNT